MRPLLLLLLSCLIFPFLIEAQQAVNTISGSVRENNKLLPGVTVTLVKAEDSTFVQATTSSEEGKYYFRDIDTGSYKVSFTHSGYKSAFSDKFLISYQSPEMILGAMVLIPDAALLNSVTVLSKAPALKMSAGNTTINVDALITNAGASALELLEKSPGVTVDKNGNIGLNGRQDIIVLIDGKQTYLPVSAIVTLLESMNASQISQIELITSPSAKYDAAGSSGIINIKTKKNKASGLNGNLVLSLGQGIYFKTNNSFVLNYRKGRINSFANIGLNENKSFTDLYAFRSYYEQDDKTIQSLLRQSSFLKGKNQNHNIRAGMEIDLSSRTAVGLAITSTESFRKNNGFSRAGWMDKDHDTDSLILTSSTGKSRFSNKGVNLNFKQSLNKQGLISADLDILEYKIHNEQVFTNDLQGSQGYREEIRGFIPAKIRIVSARADASRKLAKNTQLEAGWKTSYVNTDNEAAYYLMDGSNPIPDYSKTNNFRYRERIYAAFLDLSKEWKKWKLQGGLRNEYTHYNATQSGNPLRPDSSFNKSYNNLFPALGIDYKKDSLNTVSLRVGKRIDRPAFQKLNPFVFLINKYTYQRGNPYFLPQYSWNIELTHAYRNSLMTTLSFGSTRNYFSQVFLSDSTGVITYTEGNLAKMEIAGISVIYRFSPAGWWWVSSQASLSYKSISGRVWNQRNAGLTQFNLNINNQFQLNELWAAELSGFFITRELELQEITEPTGQIGIGISRQIFNKLGSLKLNLRDIFYTQAMKGFTVFNGATEYFLLKRDSRVANITFTYRFGKPSKTAIRKTNGGAGEEMRRAENG